LQVRISPSFPGIIGGMGEVSSPSLVLTFEAARHLVEQEAAGQRPGGLEFLPLLDAQNRILAKPVTADRDYPPFRRAMRDGFAVRAADLTTPPAVLELIGEIKAGASPETIPKCVGPGQTAAIMTGAPAPNGADAVVMVEYTSQNGSTITVTRGVAAGDNIVPSGSEAHGGEVLLQPGARLDYAALAVASSVGQQNVWVHRKPEVAILATGDEVVALDVPPGQTQIRNSNSYSLAAQVRDAGGVPRIIGIARDEARDLREKIADGLNSDLLLLTGGVSMGKYDLAEQVLEELGAEFLFTGALIQPGRPVVFGRAKAKYLFGLPGNPVSTMVTFDLFVRPMLDALAGARPQPLQFLYARLKADVRVKTGLKRFLPGFLSGEFERTEVEPARWHGSGDVVSTARANCYLVIPPDREQIPAGEWVAVMKK
jgi:molybdopterin molybdotransferase